jgi:hypothetical protein
MNFTIHLGSCLDFFALRTDGKEKQSSGLSIGVLNAAELSRWLIGGVGVCVILDLCGNTCTEPGNRFGVATRPAGDAIH